jgi:hypothetical protein
MRAVLCGCRHEETLSTATVPEVMYMHPNDPVAPRCLVMTTPLLCTSNREGKYTQDEPGNLGLLCVRAPRFVDPRA